jgi:hypothetical protein
MLLTEESVAFAYREARRQACLAYISTYPEKARSDRSLGGKLGSREGKALSGLKSRGKKHPHSPEAIENCRKVKMGKNYDRNHRSTGELSARKELFRLQSGRCWVCMERIDADDLELGRFRGRLRVHHIDFDPTHDWIQNLALSHLLCHRVYHRAHKKPKR